MITTRHPGRSIADCTTPMTTTTALTDAQLLRAHATGTDPRAFAELWSRHYAHIEKHLDRCLVNVVWEERAVLVADLCQAVWWRVHRHAAKFDEVRGVKVTTWLYSIAMNLLRNHLRDRKRGALRWPRHRNPDAAVGEWEEIEVEDHRAVSPETAMLNTELGEQIKIALALLTADHRVVAELRLYEGLRYEEMAVRLGVPIGTIRSRWSRARSQLRAYLHTYRYDVG